MGAILGGLVVTVLLREHQSDAPSAPVSPGANLAPVLAPNEATDSDSRSLNGLATLDQLASIADPVALKQRLEALVQGTQFVQVGEFVVEPGDAAGLEGA